MTTTWEAPAGGWWQLEPAHLRGAQPKVFQERAPQAFKAGFQYAGERYGLPMDYLDMRFVNDHAYVRVRPVGAPEPKRGKASKTPPALLLKVMARVHPVLRRRTKAARAALAERRWCAEAARWESGLRQEMFDTGRALQAEPVESLSDADLVAHLGRVLDHFSRGVQAHFELVPVHHLSVGRLVLACREWGIDPRDGLALLAGNSPASMASASALRAIADACTAADVDPQTLDDVRAAGPTARAALDDYLATHAWRAITHYTPKARALIEMPDLIVKAINGRRAAPTADQAPDVSTVRDRVPDSERSRFDQLLEDARRCYGNRDDNDALNFMWPTGLVRRAVLEVGRRLVERGVLDDPEQALALGEVELGRALNGDDALAQLALERTEQQAKWEADGAPLELGDPEGDPPDVSVFPRAMAELTAATMVMFDLEGFGRSPTAVWTGSGIGIGNERYSGRACVATSPEEALDRLEPGDVLVTTMTTPAYEAVMPIAGAVITERGGLVSHTALICREYGIPAVVGCAGATTAIVDGATVTVDPAAGLVIT